MEVETEIDGRRCCIWGGGGEQYLSKSANTSGICICNLDIFWDFNFESHAVAGPLNGVPKTAKPST